MSEDKLIKVEFLLSTTDGVPAWETINDLMLGWASEYEVERLEECLRVSVFSLKDAARTKHALREFDVVGEKWFAMLNGEYVAHHDGFATVEFQGRYTWVLWGIEIGEGVHMDAVQAGVASDAERFFEWLENEGHTK